ncbi:copper resistance protein CopC [Corynebacterium bovis]|uniref:copper resistance CopC family protein n=1 Tax=Corynebacterium bovis TaxID=36808 RepID=UPI003139FBAD
MTRTRTTAPRRRIAAVAAAGALCLGAGPAVAGGGVLGGLVPVAAAHDVVVSSSPANGETVTTPPRTISLEFSGQPKGDFDSVAVSRKDEKKVLFTAEPSIDGRTLTVDVPDGTDFTPGGYTVGYQITSSDGHATRGSIGFTVAGDGGATTAAGSAGSADADGSTDGDTGDEARSTGVPGWLIPVGSIIVILGALAVAISQYRRIGRSRDAGDADTTGTTDTPGAGGGTGADPSGR